MSHLLFDLMPVWPCCPVLSFLLALTDCSFIIPSLIPTAAACDNFDSIRWVLRGSILVVPVGPLMHYQFFFSFAKCTLPFEE